MVIDSRPIKTDEALKKEQDNFWADADAWRKSDGYKELELREARELAEYEADIKKRLAAKQRRHQLKALKELKELKALKELKDLKA